MYGISILADHPMREVDEVETKADSYVSHMGQRNLRPAAEILDSLLLIEFLGHGLYE